MNRGIKTVIVIASLSVLLCIVGSIGHSWWWGIAMFACVIGIGGPIGLLLIWWIER